MKLSEFLPEVPALAQQISDLNSQMGMFQLMKAGETGSAPTMGLDHVVNTWVRHQMAYRQQLVMDIQTISMSVEEIRSPVNHITQEVFRRGLEWEPTIIQLAIDSIWNTIQSKELYMIVLLVLILFAIKPWMER